MKKAQRQEGDEKPQPPSKRRVQSQSFSSDGAGDEAISVELLRTVFGALAGGSDQQHINYSQFEGLLLKDLQIDLSPHEVIQFSSRTPPLPLLTASAGAAYLGAVHLRALRQRLRVPLSAQGHHDFRRI